MLVDLSGRRKSKQEGKCQPVSRDAAAGVGRPSGSGPSVGTRPLTPGSGAARAEPGGGRGGFPCPWRLRTGAVEGMQARRALGSCPQPGVAPGLGPMPGHLSASPDEDVCK